MKKFKRFAALLLSLCLLAAMLPTTAFAEEEIVASGSCGYLLDWTLDSDGVLTISGSGDMYDNCSFGGYTDFVNAVVIEDGVTSIGNSAFSHYFNLNSITIADSVTAIGDYAFSMCGQLKSVKLPESLISIGDSAFSDCGIVNISIPDSVTTLNHNAFSHCINLTNVVIGNGITTIDYRTFEGCSELVCVTIPESVTYIDRIAFMDSPVSLVCYEGSAEQWEMLMAERNDYSLPLEKDNLVSARVICIKDANGTCGDNLAWELKADMTLEITGTGEMYNWSSSDMPWYAYRNDIKKVVINEGVTNVGDNAFYECSALTGVSFPNSLISIGNSAFYECSNINYLRLSVNVSYIDKYAFYNCGSLGYLEIPKSITYIGESAFAGCSCYEVTFSGSQAQWAEVVVETGNSLLSYISCYELGNGTCGDNLTWKLVRGYDGYYQLTISGSGEMDNWSQRNAPWYTWAGSISEIVLDKGITTIGDYAFYEINLGDYGATSVKIPEGVTSIGKGAFSGGFFHTPGESDFIIPEGVTTIGSVAFACKLYGGISIPNSVTSAGDGAFSVSSYSDIYNIYDNAKYLGNKENPYIVLIEAISDDIISCEIHPETKFINSRAFAFTDLASITIPDQVLEIGSFAFAGTDLTSITIPDQVFQIDVGAFQSCANLNSITISKSVTEIANAVFYGCYKLSDVYYDGTPEQWTEINIGQNNDCLLNANITYNEPCNHPSTDNGVCTECGETIGMIITDGKGNVVGNFTGLTDALSAVVEGQTLSLQTDVTEEDLVLPVGVNLDLNGHSLITNSILTYTGSSIIDTSENVSGLLKINEADGNMISPDNAQLPVYDSENGGYRFFAIDVQPCAVTRGNKYWFKIKAEKFAPLYELIQADADIKIKVKMTWNGQTEETYATADLSFTKAWADSYNANDDIYITVAVEEGEGLENFKLIPMITSGGVEITGKEM